MKDISILNELQFSLLKIMFGLGTLQTICLRGLRREANDLMESMSAFV